MKLLVTGGAGYIGAHVAFSLLACGNEVVIIDDFSTGVKERLLDLPGSDFVLGSILDLQLLESLFQKHDFDGIVHLAGKKSVSESFFMNDEYEKVNVHGTRHLISISLKYGVRFFIFASTAAVYDTESQPDLIPESNPLKPLSPYGESKLRAENLIHSDSEGSQIRVLSFRFFNVVGSRSNKFADKSNETLLPKIETCLRTNEPLVIHGVNLPTRDGTCIRDYIHVEDVANAILLACESLYLGEKRISKALNLGTGIGHSVKEVISLYRREIKLDLRVVNGVRRDGDPVTAVCDSRLAFEQLGWKANISPFRDITWDRFNEKMKVFQK